MFCEYNIPQGFQTIPRADKRYVVTPTGTVFNMKTQKFLRQHFDGYSTYTTITDAKGKQFRFNFDKAVIDYTPLTKEWVLDVEGAKIITDYPDYAVSHYGAVYRIVPRGKGPRAGEVFMIKEFSIKGKPYVSLVIGGEKPKQVRVDLLTKLLWGDESTY
tara:strand:+ start:572 stop:1048 length:477 start_codon:yes stop_codon:yes gene_type:complete